MKSVLKYIGMKDVELNNYGFSNNKIYCEPFSGSFNTGFNLYESGYKGKLVYNDSDDKVVNFWICLRDNSNKLYDYCNKLDSIIRNQVTELEKIKTLEFWSNSKNKFRRAASEYIFRKAINVNGNKLNWNYRNDLDMLSFGIFSEYLKNIEINKMDYKGIIDKYDSDETFLFLDPPYNVKNAHKYYRINDNFNHEQLRDVLVNTKSKWLLTYNDDEYIRELYKDFNIQSIKRKIASVTYNELYITN